MTQGLAHGSGEWTSENGIEVYSGTWRNNKPDGVVRYKAKGLGRHPGIKIKGEMREGVWHGYRTKFEPYILSD